MAKTKSAKPSVSSDRKDNFFVRAKNNTVSKKSKTFAPEKQKNTFFKGNKHIPKTNVCGSGFFLNKTESSRSGDQADNNDQRKQTAAKKPFDKKKWRMQKYSKKYKLQQWEEKRKKAVSREYYKQVKGDEPGFDVQKLYAEESVQDDDDEESVPSVQDQEKNIRKNQTVQNRYEQMRHEKEERKAEVLRKKEERRVALEAYKKKKHEKFRKLSLKNKKGQPIMKHRMEMLLEQIQKTCT